MARTTSSSTNIEVQMIELVRKEVDNDLKLEKKYIKLYLEVIDIHNQREKEIGELEKFNGDPMTVEVVCMLKRVQSRDMKKVARLQIMVVESHLKEAPIFCYQISDSDDTIPAGNISLAQPIICDLVLVENQIPFFVLNGLFECTILTFESDLSVTEFIFPVLKLITSFEGKLRIFDPVELAKAGVNFKPNQNKPGAFTIEFQSSTCNPTLTMPVLRIEEYTEPVLRNLVAYEQFFQDVGNHVTSYVVAMMKLIDTKEDYLKLVEYKLL
ncbi:putative UPF0481 protein [Tanacetum coccineum]